MNDGSYPQEWIHFAQKCKFNKISADSRTIKAGDLFIAYPGEYTDGRDYLQAALDNGASAVVYDDGQFQLPEAFPIPALAVENLQQRAGEVTSCLLGHCAQSLNVIGVTGTNGKTSISQWLAQAFSQVKQKCAVIGTVGNGFMDDLKETTYTTPDAVTVQNLLADFVAQGAKTVAMEVSSHALTQSRVNGVCFSTAIFTNLTRDHLDYHGDMAHYAEAKSRLFDWPSLHTAIINIDDDYGRTLVQKLRDRHHPNVISYGFSADADISITHFEGNSTGSLLQAQTPWGEISLRYSMLGRFNALNMAACVGAMVANGVDLQESLSVLSQIRAARGRMECIIYDNQPLVVVDYAHTPDALEKALKSLQQIKSSDAKLWCVFGCGGNRDKGKRPMMGKIAADNADCVVVTSDNPRLEDPQEILNDILPAVPTAMYVDVDRQKAIAFAVRTAQEGDMILIAGKGHETYQDIGGVKHHFDDFEIAERYLSERVRCTGSLL